MRNVAAFHIDKEIINAGLANMFKDSVVVPLAEGDGRKNVRSRMSVGTLVLHAGLWSSLDAYGDFIRIVGREHDLASRRFKWLSSKSARKPASPSKKHWPVARHSEGRTAAVNTFGS